MKIFLLLICLYITQLSAFQSFKIIDENNSIKILNKPAYFSGEISHKEAYKKFKNGDFSQLKNKEAKSFGFSNAPLWIALELINNSDEKRFLTLMNTSLERVELFKYRDNKLISSAKNGVLVQNNEKDVKSFEPMFNLNIKNTPITYLLKINSLSPLIAPIYISDEVSLLNLQQPRIILFAIFSGVILSLLLYNLFLYLSTQEIDYALYTAYTFFIFILIVYTREYLHFWLEISASSDSLLETIGLEGASIFLLLFTLKFFNIKELHPKIYRSSLIIGFLASLLFLLTLFLSIFGQYANIIIFAIVNLLSLYICIVSYFNNYTPAKYFCIALGGFLVGSMVFIGINIGFIPYTIYTDSAMLAGTAWEVMFFSLALGYRIKLLHEERNEAISKLKVQDKILFLQSRQASVGELVGNIAHQWREPLAEIGSIQTNLKATLLFKGSVVKEKLLSSIEQSYSIIRHLSDTIDTFYRFFRHKISDKEEFSVNEEIKNLQKMVHYSLEVENITLKYDAKTEISVFGDSSELSNALLNIILNAKDVLVERKVENPLISITNYRSGDDIFIRVEDNAGGINQEPIEKVFDISISSKAEGIGIGLYIAKSIIERRMRGKLSVENGTQGAVFTIMLPAVFEVINLEEESELYDIEESAIKKIDMLEKQVARSLELEKALSQWEDIFNQTHWGVAVHKGASNYFEMVNPAFCRMYGYSEKELKDKSVQELFSDESLEVLDEKQKEAFTKGFVSFEAIHVRKDGSKFPVNIDITVIKNENGEILYHIANVRDITEQKQANARLLLKKFAIDHINESIYLADENGKFYYVNEGACRSLGYTQEEMLKLGVADIDPDWPAERWSENWEFLKEHKTAIMALRHQRKDGTIFPVEIVANYFVYDGVPYIMGFARDITERLLLEEQRDNERMRLFFERQLVGMAITSANKGWLQVNDKFCEMLGYSREELEGLTWNDLTHPDDLTSSFEYFERLINGDIDDYMVEKRYIRKDKEVVYTNLAVSCVRSQDGSVEYILALLEDITERKQMEDSLRKNQKFLVDAQRVSHVGSWELDIQNNILSWSDETYRIFELNKEDVSNLHKTFYDYVHPDDREMVSTLYEESLKTKLPYEVDHKILMPDGRVKYVTERCETSYDENGISLYSIGTVHDITERKLMEKELADSHSFLNKLIDSVPDPIFVKDREHRWKILNKAFCEFIEKSHSELIGKSDYDFFPKEEADVFWEKDEFVFNSKDVNINEEDFTSSDGVTHRIETVKSMFENGDGKQYLVGTIRDITKRIEATNALKEKSDELQKALAFNEGIINAIPDLLFEVDKDGVYVGVWAQDKELLVSQREILLGKNYKDVLPPDVVKVASESINEVDEKGYSLGNSYSLELTSGKKWFELSVSKKSSSDTYMVLARDITKRKEAEEAVIELNMSLENRVAERTLELQQSLEFTKGIINAIPDLLFEVDREGTYLGVWAQNEELLATQKEYLLGKNFKDVLSGEATKIALEGIKEADEKGLSFGKIIKIDLDDGEHWFELSTSAKRISGTFLVISRDITYRKKAEDSLRESEEKFRAMVENSPDVIIRYDLDGRRTYVNPIGQLLMNKPLENIIGKAPKDNSPLPTTHEFEKVFAKVVSEGKELTIEAPYIMPNGEERWGEQRIIPELDDNGNVVSVLLVGRDLTERKKLESMHQELELLGSALDHTSEAIYLIDNDLLSIIYVNDGACKMLGYTQEELCTMNLSDIDAEHSLDEIADVSADVIKNQELFFETKHKKKNGDIIDVEIVGSTFIFNNKRVGLSVVKDITHKKEKDKQVKLLQTAINRGNDAVYIIGDDRSILYVNDVACNMLGYTREELLRMKVEDIDKYMSTDEVDNVKTDLLNKKEIIFRTKHQAKNKKLIDVEIKVTEFEHDKQTLRLSIVKAL
ncbi:PAS domain S-box protein [Sulfurimonas sp.]|uniref:PAS domain S-box protein n=1 Tax=Sulfurimonas sp. TaxID=2022749 RepID=UPI003566F1BF